MPITINGSTGISGVDGSAGTPAVIGSDADTGLVFAAGQVSASINGVAGNVPLVSGTAQNSTSGTSIDFTGIPSWVKRVTVVFYRMSTSGTSVPIVRVGTSSGIVSSGYESLVAYGTGSAGMYASDTTHFGLASSGGWAASVSYSGLMSLVNISSNTWVMSLSAAPYNSTVAFSGGGSIPLSGTLDRIRITTVNGTDTFDGGSVNILYE